MMKLAQAVSPRTRGLRAGFRVALRRPIRTMAPMPGWDIEVRCLLASAMRVKAIPETRSKAPPRKKAVGWAIREVKNGAARLTIAAMAAIAATYREPRLNETAAATGPRS